MLGGVVAIAIMQALPAIAQIFSDEAIAQSVSTSSPLQASFQQSEQYAAVLAAQIDMALRQTAQRLTELTRQDLSVFERQRVYLESANGEWPVTLYAREEDSGSLTVFPHGEKLLSLDDLDSVRGRSAWVGVRPKRQSLIVAVPAPRGSVIAATIPLSVFTAPLEGLSVGSEGMVALVDAEGRVLTGKALGSEESELLGTIAAEAKATLVSKQSLLASARIPSSGWNVVLRMPLAEANRGVVLTPIDEKAFAVPWYVTKREPGFPDGMVRNALLSLVGVALLPLALALVNRRFRDPLLERARGLRGPGGRQRRSSEDWSNFTPQAAMLDDLLRDREPPEAPMLSLGGEPAVDNARAEDNVGEVQIRLLQGELRRVQEQARREASEAAAQLSAMQAHLMDRMESVESRLQDRLRAELQEVAARRSSDHDRFRSELQEVSIRQAADHDRVLRQIEDAAASQMAGLNQLRQEIGEVLLQLEEQDSEGVRGLREEIDRLRAMQLQLAERGEGQSGSLQAELQAYQNQSAAFAKQTSERMNQLGPMLEILHTRLRTRDEEHARMRDEVSALAARVSRIVQLIAKTRPGT